MPRSSNVHLFFLTEVIYQKDIPWLQGEFIFIYVDLIVHLKSPHEQNISDAKKF